MKLARQIGIFTTIIALTSPVCPALGAADTPQSLYLQAGKEERSGSAAKAREIYESIIDRFPESEFAVKANDRLLTIAPAGRKTVETPQPSPLTILAPKAASPLPSDPLLRRGVEMARMKARAELLYRDEIERERELFFARYGHRVNRGVLSEKERMWQESAERKVVEQYGMTIEEMGKKLIQLCGEAKVKGECGEEGFQLLSTP